MPAAFLVSLLIHLCWLFLAGSAVIFSSKPELLIENAPPQEKFVPVRIILLDQKNPSYLQNIQIKKFDPDKIAALLRSLKDKNIPDIEFPEDPEELRLSTHDISAFKAQMSRCWSIPAGAKNIHKIAVRIKIFLTPSGYMLIKPIPLDEMKGRDSFFRTAMESALRAVLRCQPFRMPPEKYESWKEITLTFRAGDLLTGGT